MNRQDIINRYNIAVPRYTSYPTADKFYSPWNEKDLIDAISLSNTNGTKNISVYVHIPFCPQRCHFCGCNTDIYPREKFVERYINTVLKEIDKLLPLVDKDREVTQISFGGGTPNSIKLKYIGSIVERISRHLNIASWAEIAIECSPAYLRIRDIDTLKAIGFNRISLGIQDFHPEVLKAINRAPSLLSENVLLERMRQLGFKGINIDLVYGLPFQSAKSFLENIDRIIELEPDRLATFSYAHVPWVNESQKLLEQYPMPSAGEKLNMLIGTIEKLETSGKYKMIGMDHFALENDLLCKAKREGLLKRNFQGYNTTETMGQVVAFGCSAISQLDDAFSQNIKSTSEYIISMEKDIIPAMRGYRLSKEEKIVRHVIDQIMCNGYLDIREQSKLFGISIDEFMNITSFDRRKIQNQIDDNLVSFEDNVLSVSAEGMMIVRTIACAFDPRFKISTNHHSQSI